jgi:hypothetical protein
MLSRTGIESSARPMRSQKRITLVSPSVDASRQPQVGGVIQPIYEIASGWRVVGPSHRTIVCGIYEGATGSVEVRCHYAGSIDALVRSEPLTHRHRARRCRRMEAGAIDKGFDEVKGDRPEG